VADSPNIVLDAPLNRKVLMAVELIDPISLALVSSGVSVSAQGLKRKPLINLSGRFVWLEEDAAWPTQITVNSTDGRFANQTVPAPPKPPDLDEATAAERLARVTLSPSAAYEFGSGITAVRGCLRKDGTKNSPPVPGMRVQLAWLNEDTHAWVQQSSGAVLTDVDGEFATWARPQPPAGQRADIKNGLLAVRLEFTRGGVTLVTPTTFPFMTGGTTQPPTGRILEGETLGNDLQVNLTQLGKP
jgi:hypothetical protein